MANLEFANKCYELADNVASSNLDNKHYLEWQHLYRSVSELTEFVQIPSACAEILANVGWRYSIRDKNWETAIQLLDRLFTHPKFVNNEVFVIVNRCRYAYTLLLAGREEDGLNLYRQYLSLTPRKWSVYSKHAAQNHFLHYCSDYANQNELATLSLTKYICDLCNFYDVKSPKIFEPKTYFELKKLLLSTYPEGFWVDAHEIRLLDLY